MAGLKQIFPSILFVDSYINAFNTGLSQRKLKISFIAFTFTPINSFRLGTGMSVVGCVCQMLESSGQGSTEI